jgi:hypothetical protein
MFTVVKADEYYPKPKMEMKRKQEFEPESPTQQRGTEQMRIAAATKDNFVEKSKIVEEDECESGKDVQNGTAETEDQFAPSSLWPQLPSATSKPEMTTKAASAGASHQGRDSSIVKHYS